MTIGDILVNTNRANLNNLLPLSEVKTKKDFAKFKKKGYTVGMTAGEFQEKYPLLPIENIYASYNILSSLYYCEPQNPTIPIVLNLQIYSPCAGKAHSVRGGMKGALEILRNS